MHMQGQTLLALLADMDDAPAARGIELRFPNAAAKYWMVRTSV